MAHSPTYYCEAIVESYNKTNGELSFFITKVVGSSTFESTWTININGVSGSSGTSGTSGVNGTSGSSGTGGYLKITELLYNVQAITGSSTPNSFVPDWTCYYTSVSGSTIMFNGSYTAYCTVTGTKEFFLVVDGQELAGYSYTFGETGRHHTIPCIFNVEQLSGGTHTIKLKIPSGVIVDSYDYMSLTVIETMSNGISGSSGSNGSSGTSGTSGSNGSSGTSGSNGSSGTSGINGSSGTSGINGSNGSSGTSGSNGSSGTSGSNGSSGTSGASLSGSNTFSGANTFTGQLTISNGVGSGGSLEGGEIDLQYASNTTLTGSFVALDVYGDKVRIFEGGGNARGVSIDLSKAPAGVGGELMFKSSGCVNSGTIVTLGDIQVQFSTSGNRSLQIKTLGSNFSATVAGYAPYTSSGNQFQYLAGQSISVTGTMTYLLSSWHFTGDGDVAVYHVRDTTNLRFWRITLMVGPTYSNNMITIERLY
jgi:hypothetical protein